METIGDMDHDMEAMDNKTARSPVTKMPCPSDSASLGYPCMNPEPSKPEAKRALISCNLIVINPQTLNPKARPSWPVSSACLCGRPGLGKDGVSASLEFRVGLDF